MPELQDAVIVSAVRTAIGTYGGGLAEMPAVKLGEICIRAALERADLKPNQIEEVIMGNVLQAGLGQNPARQAAVNAGLTARSEEHTSELQSRQYLVCRLLLEKKKKKKSSNAR